MTLESKVDWIPSFEGMTKEYFPRFLYLTLTPFPFPLSVILAPLFVILAKVGIQAAFAAQSANE